jgi:hypothetical protein
LNHKHREDLHGCVDAVHAGIVVDRVIVHEHRVVTLRGETVRSSWWRERSRTPAGRHVRGFLVRTGAGDPEDRHRGRTALLQRTFGIQRATAQVLASRTLPL